MIRPFSSANVGTNGTDDTNDFQIEIVPAGGPRNRMLARLPKPALVSSRKVLPSIGAFSRTILTQPVLAARKDDAVQQSKGC
jgi:hypothetical protein